MTLQVRNWTRGHVYLFTYPRCRRIPNISEWSLKLETWLRMMNVPYTAHSNNFLHYSTKGQVPFVELNGRQIADSNIIIETVSRELGLNTGTSNQEPIARAITALVEEQLTPTMMALRLPGLHFITSKEAWGPYLGRGPVKWIKRARIQRRLKKEMTARALAQGCGRHSYNEQHEIAFDALQALSTLLGEHNRYFRGNHPSTLDCTVFGHIASLVYAPTPDGILTDRVRETHPNLGRFIATMKERYWPDWEETCRTGNMNTHQRTENQ